MTVQWIAIIVAVFGNILAWAYTYGKLNQQVTTLSKTLGNGLCAKVSNLSIEVAYLKATIESLAKQINERKNS